MVGVGDGVVGFFLVVLFLLFLWEGVGNGFGRDSRASLLGFFVFGRMVEDALAYSCVQVHY